MVEDVMEPKPIKSSGLRINFRPERYEWEEISNSPPPSTQNILQVFDTNSFVKDHPRKYQLLLAQDDGEQNIPETSGFQRRRRNSEISLNDGSLDSFKKTKSLVDLKTFFQESTRPTDRFQGHEAHTEMNDSSKLNLKSTDLSVIAKKYAGFSEQYDSQDRRLSLGIPKVLDGNDKEVDDGLLNTESEKAVSITTATSEASVNKNGASCDKTDLVPVSIQPEPRRFLGIGGLFKPLPETLLVPKNEIKSQTLTDEIQKLGITATVQGQRKGEASVDVADCKKKVPTRAELNMWAPSGL